MERFGNVLAGTGRPLVIASGTAGIAPGQVGTERDGHGPAPTHPGGGPEARRGTAELTLALADRGARPVVLRLPPTDEPVVTKQCAAAFEAVWERAVPHGEYQLR